MVYLLTVCSGTTICSTMSVVKSLKAGDLLAVNNKYIVTHVDDEWVHCTTYGTDSGIRFGVKLVEESVFSAAQFTSEQKVTSTELSAKLKAAGHAVFTCVFTKKPTVKAGAAHLDNNVDLGSAAKRRKVAQAILTGEARVLRGCLARHGGPEESGRVSVIDLEVTDGSHNQRLIDLRTITELILENVRYVLKK